MGVVREPNAIGTKENKTLVCEGDACRSVGLSVVHPSAFWALRNTGLSVGWS